MMKKPVFELTDTVIPRRSKAPGAKAHRLLVRLLAPINEKLHQKAMYRGDWFASWSDTTGHRRGRTLGPVKTMTKGAAQQHLNTLLRPLNEQRSTTPSTFGDLVNNVVIPWAERRWKHRTVFSTNSRIVNHLVGPLRDRRLVEITRHELQAILDEKAQAGLSTAVLAHLRWDLRMCFRVAVAEGYLERNPAELLRIPRGKTYQKRYLTKAEAITFFQTFDLRERLMLKLAGISGMRAGEIVGLHWQDVQANTLSIRRRVYRGMIDTPKTTNSVRRVALSPLVRADLASWRGLQPHANPEDWVFASERGTTPVNTNTVWRRHISPVLKKLGLGWVNYLVLRRSCSSLLNDLGVEGKVVADQLGHTLDVKQNVYTRVAIERPLEAVSKLDAILRPMESHGVLN